MAKGGGSVSVKSNAGATVDKGAIRTPFTDAVFTRKGVSSPSPASKNK